MDHNPAAAAVPQHVLAPSSPAPLDLSDPRLQGLWDEVVYCHLRYDIEQMYCRYNAILENRCPDFVEADEGIVEDIATRRRQLPAHFSTADYIRVLRDRPFDEMALYALKHYEVVYEQWQQKLRAQPPSLAASQDPMHAPPDNLRYAIHTRVGEITRAVIGTTPMRDDLVKISRVAFEADIADGHFTLPQNLDENDALRQALIGGKALPEKFGIALRFAEKSLIQLAEFEGGEFDNQNLGQYAPAIAMLEYMRKVACDYAKTRIDQINMDQGIEIKFDEAALTSLPEALNQILYIIRHEENANGLPVEALNALKESVITLTTMDERHSSFYGLLSNLGDQWESQQPRDEIFAGMEDEPTAEAPPPDRNTPKTPPIVHRAFRARAEMQCGTLFERLRAARTALLAQARALVSPSTSAPTTVLPASLLGGLSTQHAHPGR